MRKPNRIFDLEISAGRVRADTATNYKRILSSMARILAVWFETNGRRFNKCV